MFGPEIEPMFKLADILSHQDLLDATLLNTLFQLIIAMHAQLAAILSAQTKEDRPAMTK